MTALHEELLPVFDNSDELGVLVEADLPTTWRALLETDLLEVGRTHRLVGVLGAVRMLPEIAQGLIHGETPGEMPASMRLGELGDAATGDGSWAKLGERDETEIAFGLVGKFWKPVIEYATVPTEEFTSFDQPGWAKTIYAFTLKPVWDGTLLTGVMRTATTDEHARKWFRRYWTYGVGSGAHILVDGVLDSARETAEQN